ncbi:hypothetical protein ACFVIM_13355 [Streptomyces sp. NPDC057638]|uniref:hypothetical protein n=1 Tax=Streptomyces sp. NPDC057638 TaxID=3346190 RepID=UPI003692F2AB
MPTARTATTPPERSPRPDGGDACPGALRLHRADDGALARIRIPGGVLTADQAGTLGAAARELGDGTIHLTSRGNAQLRGLAEGCGAELAQLLTGCGLLPSLTHERVRNIVASPLSGLGGGGPDGGSPDGGGHSGGGHSGTRNGLSGLDGLSGLNRLNGGGNPGTPGAGLGDGGEPDTHGHPHGPHGPQGTHGTHNAAGHADIRPWLTALDALLCASAEARALSGRFLFALDDGRGDMAALGADITVRARPGGHAELTLATAPGALTVPSADAAEAALAAAETFLAAARPHGARIWRLADLPGDPSALTAALVRRLGTPLHEAAPAPSVPITPTPGLITGPTATTALSVLAPLGALSPERWDRLVRTARRFGDELRLTPWRGIVIPGPPSHDAAVAALAELGATGLITTPASPWHGVGACIGRPGCAKSLADVRADAAAALPPPVPGALPVHWSGCDRRCGHPRADHVEVVATPAGYQVTLVRGAARAAVVSAAPTPVPSSAAPTPVPRAVSTPVPSAGSPARPAATAQVPPAEPAPGQPTSRTPPPTPTPAKPPAPSELAATVAAARTAAARAATGNPSRHTAERHTAER